MNSLEAAQQLDSWGFCVIPARFRGKRPTVEWKKYQDERSTAQLAAWFGRGKYNFWIACGQPSGVVVLDVDNREADEYWRKKLGSDTLDRTTAVKTSKGFHYYFRLKDGQEAPSWSVHEEDGVSFDVRGDGTGVIVPPSVHESGHVYEFVRGVEYMLPVPKQLLEPSDAPSVAIEGGSAPRSMLSELLRKPPTEGGRNVWLTQVAGHLAKVMPWEDAFAEAVAWFNRGLSAPLPDDEIDKMVESIWGSEKRKTATLARPVEENGWLVGDGSRLWTEAKQGEDLLPAPWADFDIRVVGILDDDKGRCYGVEIQKGGRTITDLLEPGVLGRPAELMVWLSSLGCTILPPSGDIHRGSASARLQRYLESQEAPQYVATTSLGWHENIGYVCHEGTIGVDGLHSHDGIMPHPRLRNWAPYQYGFVDEKRAKDLLRRVLTFHDETVCSVFGAWWAACIVKAQIMEETALFPFMALEAPSESGKSTGFFALMIQMNGNKEGHGEYTLPVLRDRASGHRNGIVWVDDLSAPEPVLDLLRQVTSEGGRAKKSADRTRQESVRLVAPVVISAEGLGALALEKALLDRAVRLQVPSPKERRAADNPSRPQWDDIKDLMKEWGGDLTQAAGTYIQMALQHADIVKELRTLRVGNGRHADKIAILRVGARLLSALTDDPIHIDRVDAWCGAQEDLGSENVLTTQILPNALREFHFPSSSRGHVPVFVDGGVVYYSEAKLSDWWSTINKDPRSRQLGSQQSLMSQRMALGIEGTGSRRVVQDTRKTGGRQVHARYHELPSALSEKVIERSGMMTSLGRSSVINTESDQLFTGSDD